MDTLDFFMPFLLGRYCDEHLMMCEHPFLYSWVSCQGNMSSGGICWLKGTCVTHVDTGNIIINWYNIVTCIIYKFYFLTVWHHPYCKLPFPFDNRKCCLVNFRLSQSIKLTLHLVSAGWKFSYVEVSIVCSGSLLPYPLQG